MKFLVYKVKDEIRKVTTVSHYMYDNEGKQIRTEETVLEQVTKSNAHYAEDPEDYPHHYEIIELTDDSNLAEPFKFLLGEERYRIAHNIQELYEYLEDLKSDIEKLSTDVYDLYSPLDTISEKAKKLFKIEENRDV